MGGDTIETKVCNKCYDLIPREDLPFFVARGYCKTCEAHMLFGYRYHVLGYQKEGADYSKYFSVISQDYGFNPDTSKIIVAKNSKEAFKLAEQNKGSIILIEEGD